MLVAGSSVGILVQGDNHFIVRGPEPDWTQALALARHWSIVHIGHAIPPELSQWQISSREFRENLEWAVVVPGDGVINLAVVQLLSELAERGIAIHTGP